jgi:hypothetical protein
MSLYPEGTKAQLQAFCGYLSQDRDLPRVAWRMWWAGYPVPMHSVRSLLVEAAELWEGWMSALREELLDTGAGDAGADFSDAVWDLIDSAETARSRRTLLTRMRKRVGRRSFPTIFRIVLEVSSGQFTGFRVAPKGDARDDERLLVSKAIGSPASGATNHMRLAGSIVAFDMEAYLKGASRVMGQAQPRANLAAMTDAELRQLRDELRVFEPLLAVTPDLVAEMSGKWARAVHDIVQALLTMAPIDQAIAVLLWYELRRYGLGPMMDAYLRLAELLPLWLPVAREQLRVGGAADTGSAVSATETTSDA